MTSAKSELHRKVRSRRIVVGILESLYYIPNPSLHEDLSLSTQKTDNVVMGVAIQEPWWPRGHILEIGRYEFWFVIPLEPRTGKMHTFNPITGKAGPGGSL